MGKSLLRRSDRCFCFLFRAAAAYRLASGSRSNRLLNLKGKDEGIKIAVSILVMVIFGLVVWWQLGKNQTAEFERALYAGDVGRVEQLLKEHPSLVRAKNMESGWKKMGWKPVVATGWSPLHVAAYMGNTPMVSLLLRHHAEVNARDSRGLTPLLWTAFQGNRDAAAELLSNGADINAAGPDGRTTLDLAKLSLDEKMIGLLRERGAKE